MAGLKIDGYTAGVNQVIKAVYEDGVFKPEGAVDLPEHEEVAIAISSLEAWARLKLAESAFRFWDNADDAVYDTL